MARIFLALSAFAILLIVGNLLLAVVIGDFGVASRKFAKALDGLHRIEETAAGDAAVQEQLRQFETAKVELRSQRERFWPHVWLGILASLVTLLVNSISITYFIGTSRWCREVVDAYGMSQELAEQSQRLKRKAFPCALAGILVVIVIVCLGAAADPFASLSAADWVTWHWSIALLGVAVICWGFYVQVGTVGANYELIQQILAEAERLRNEQQQVASDA